MDGYHAIPLRRSDLLHRLHRAIFAGVVHKNIDAVELRLGFRDETFTVFFFGHIGGYSCGAPARIANFLRHCFNF